MNSLNKLFSTNPIFLAPMFEVTNLPFRLFCKKQGADASVTEFVSVNQLIYVMKNNLQSSNSLKYMLQTVPYEKPVGLQLFGFDPVHFLNVGKIFDVQKAGFDFLDLNIGCPVPKICNIGAGSKLLTDEQLPKLEHILKNIKKAFPEIPFSIKIRAGYKKFLNLEKFTEMINSIDLLHVTIHPKLAVNQHKDEPNKPNHDLSKELVELTSHPVIINGEITSLQIANNFMKYTGAAGAMIGRQAQKYPWVFNESYQEKIPVQNYIADLEQFLELNQVHGFGKLYMVRDQILSMVRGFSGSKRKRQELQYKIDSLNDLKKFISDLEKSFDTEGINYVKNIVGTAIQKSKISPNEETRLLINK